MIRFDPHLGDDLPTSRLREPLSVTLSCPPCSISVAIWFGLTLSPARVSQRQRIIEHCRNASGDQRLDLLGWDPHAAALGLVMGAVGDVVAVAQLAFIVMGRHKWLAGWPHDPAGKQAAGLLAAATLPLDMLREALLHRFPLVSVDERGWLPWNVRSLWAMRPT